MDKSIFVKTGKKNIQHYFVSKELQITITILVVLALLGGAFLQSLSSALSSFFGFSTPALTVFLTIGYIMIVAILSVFFAHKFLGPFKRLEYEMKIISSGELDKRLSIRTKDDLYVRNFVAYINKFIENFENMSKDYNKLYSAISVQTGDIIKKIEKGEHNPEEIKETLETLHKRIHELREKW